MGIGTEIGIMVCAFAGAYLLFQLAKMYKTIADDVEMMSLYERTAIKNHAKKKGINLDIEIAKEGIFDKMSKKRTFQTEVRKQIMDDLFGKEKQ